MSTPRISIIAAVGQNRELGKKNGLIWRIGADLKRVKEITMGHPIIMGWNTYQSIGRPLPGRTNIVLSFRPMKIGGCVVATSLEEALTKAREVEQEEIFIFGGASVYKEAIGSTDRLYLTRIEATDTDADAFFPDYSEFAKVLNEEKHFEYNPPYTWLTLER
ncbi:MAG: dihydrofolate reductase [Candidatus Kaiserbacteria bacterium]|nr:dihydrofolate reductase [Candidatus Kaiserbacteria bacterium]